ncbi:MAG: adenylosuccinate synthase, partial [Myxococcales bacterium]|nr:adenylosuccinate synthase [Myxococcales bacterium]
MPALVVVGAQWGDEGKGKVVDLFAPHAEVVVRYAGGANAGHTLVVGGEKLILHLIPSGILHSECRSVIGQGTVVDPEVLLGEIDALETRGVEASARLLLSDRAHVVLPHHKRIDAMRERGEFAIGTTKRGIGPTYEDKVARRGVRVGDLLHPGEAGRVALRDRISALQERWRPYFEQGGVELPDPDAIASRYAAFGARLAPLVCDTSRWVHFALRAGKRILLEGAQGTLLDVDHGTYPFVTSSNSIAGGACTGAGIGPTQIDRVVGIAKAYATRVGDGPFPTELLGDQGDALRNAGAEFGSTTGRPRRCGWLDAAALR